MATPATAGAGEHSIQMPAVTAADASGDDESGKQLRAPEETLNRFVRYVAFLEWLGNAFGLLFFTWGTVVLLAGYTSLKNDDLWFGTVITFIEAFRIFSRGYTLDSHSLFGTTRAVTWMSSFARRLASPQGNEVVVNMVLWMILVYKLTAIGDTESSASLYGETLVGVFDMLLLMVLSQLVLTGVPQMGKGPPRSRQLQLYIVLIAFLLICAYNLRADTRFGLAADIAYMVTVVVAVLLLNMRPRCIGNRMSSPCGRRLLSLAKVISALWMAATCSEQLVDQLGYYYPLSDQWYILLGWSWSTPFTTVVLSLGSLQEQVTDRDTSLTDRAINFMVHIFLLWNLVLPIPPFLFEYWTYISEPGPLPIASSVIILAALLFGNLQIPLAAVQFMISTRQLQKEIDYQGSDWYYPEHGHDRNVLGAVTIFYGLALIQGALYTMACVIGLFSFFPRRLLVLKLKLSGQPGAKAIHLYYQDAYATRMKIGVVSAGQNRISLASFAMDSLCSSSCEMQLAGLIILDRLLVQESQSSDMLISRITSSDKGVSTLIAMLSWTAKQDREIRLFAARVTTMLAASLRVIMFPGMVSMVSSLLDAENSNQPPAEKDPSLASATTPVQHQQGEAAASNNWSCWVWVRRYWQRMEDKWSLPKETTWTHQDSCPPVIGLIILEKLAHDYENCAEIFKATNLISKIIGLMSFSSTYDNQSCEEESLQYAVICSSLEFIRRLASTGEEIGVNIRQELQRNPFLLNNLTGILDDPRSSPRLWTPAMDIIAKLLLHKGAGKEIGRTKEIIGKLMHTFLGRYGPANMDDNQSLPMVAGDALANLAIWGSQNCTAILEEPGYQVIKDLNNLLRENDYRYAAASVLQNLCAHCRDKLMSHPDASDHLSSTLTTVMEHIMEAEGKQLESLIGLATQIGDVILEPFVREVESQPNTGAELVQKLVCTLNTSKIPNPEHPRMRRVIVKIVITILRSCHHTVEKLMEEDMMEGLMEAVTKIDRTPSKVENYRLFYGNKGVVPENEEPMTTLVARAKGLIRRTTLTAGTSSNRR